MCVFFKLLNSLTLGVRLIFLFFFVFFSFQFNANASYLNFKDNNLFCEGSDCSIYINSNQKLEFGMDHSNYIEKKIIKLIENGEVTRYYFYTTDFNKILAYSGQPLEIIIALNNEGIIDDIKLVKHSEPIILVGIHIEKLLEVISFYKGRSIKDDIRVGENINDCYSVPIIAGATVTSLILHETIIATSRNIGSLYGIYQLKYETNSKLREKFTKLTWNDLCRMKIIKRLSKNLLVDLYYADISHPSIGRSLLGDNDYNILINNLNLDGYISAIIMLNNGSWSIKGSRGGIYDKFHIEQNGNIIQFRDKDCDLLYDLHAINLELFKEFSIFKINSSLNYTPCEPWNMVLFLDSNIIKDTYSIPNKFVEKKIFDNLVIKTWSKDINKIYLYFLFWFFIMLVFFFRNIISKKISLSYIYNPILVLAVLIGYISGQSSIVNVLALIGTLNISFLYTDTFICFSWIMIIVTVIFWGKSFFCGWVCPFGALQEILFKIRSTIGIRNFEFSEYVISKFKYLKYVIFLSLFIISFYNFSLAQKLAGIEPFKTVWVLGISSGGISSVYAILLIIISFFLYRFFCRFLCPLGAFLSLLSFFQIFKLSRWETCNYCKICNKTCNSFAIDKNGKIDNMECFGCFTCIKNMSEKLCPVLLKKEVHDKRELY